MFIIYKIMVRKSKAKVGGKKRGKGVLKSGQRGDGFMDIFKKVAGAAKMVSDATGVKPSMLLAASGHPLAGLAGSVLASQGLGRRGRGRAGGCKQNGEGFWDDFSRGFAMPFKAVGDLASGAVGGLLGNGRRGRGRRGNGIDECPVGYPGVGGSASLIKV